MHLLTRSVVVALIVVTGVPSVSNAQYPTHPDSLIIPGPTYLDAGLATYGFEIAVSGEPVNNWGGALFLRAYPGPKSPLYTLDADYVAGVKVKYYGWFPKGFYSGPMAGGLVSETFRPWAGAVLGYDYYTRFSERSEFKNIHVGLDIQAGMDTEGDGFMGAGVRFGIGFRSGDRPFGDD